MTDAKTKLASDKMERVRTFNIVQLRDDGKDALAQVLLTLEGLIKEKTTGQIVININNGGVSNMQIKESQKV